MPSPVEPYFNLPIFFCSVATVHIVAPIVRIGAYGLNLALYMYHKKWGVVTSGTIFVFWSLEAICGGITFRSVIISGTYFKKNIDPLMFCFCF